MAWEDLFKDHEEFLNKSEDAKEGLKKEPTKLDKEHVQKIKETTEQRVQEKIGELKAKAKPKYKSSIYDKIDKEDIYILADLINKKVLSYQRAHQRLVEVYSEDIPELKTHKWHSFRYYLIKREILDRPESLKSINKAISKSGFALSRRDRIVSDVIEDIFENHIDRLLEEFEKRRSKK